MTIKMAMKKAEETREVVGCGLTLTVPDEENIGSLLLPLTNNAPDVEVMMSVPWWEEGLTVDDVTGCQLEDESPPKWLHRALSAIGRKVYLCAKVDQLSEKYISSVLRDALGEAIDDRILTGSAEDGLLGVIGGSTSVSVDNEALGVVSLADVEVMIAALKPRYQPDCVLGFNTQTWAAIKAEVKASMCCGRIDEAAQTLDGRRVIISNAIQSGQACAFAPHRYMTGGGVAFVSPCSSCGDIGKFIPAHVYIAGALSGTPIAGQASGAYLSGKLNGA